MRYPSPRSLAAVLGAALLVAATGAPAAASSAADWPQAPIKLIVPYGPGSTPDLVARLVADRLAPKLGQPLIVENKAGAAGNLGTDAVAKARPDGETIGISIAGPLGVNALLFKSLPYDPAKDLGLVTIAATQPSVLVVSPSLRVDSTAALIALLEKHPGQYNFSSMGAGTISHLAMEALAAQAGTDIVHLPYKGSGPAVQAVLAGEANMAVLPAAAVMPLVKAGKLTALAVATAKRSPVLPGLPTLGESGLEGVQADAWMGFIVPARVAAPIVARLHEAIVAVLREPDVVAKLHAQYMDPVGDTPAQFRSVLDGDIARWKPVIAVHHIRLD